MRTLVFIVAALTLAGCSDDTRCLAGSSHASGNQCVPDDMAVQDLAGLTYVCPASYVAALQTHTPCVAFTVCRWPWPDADAGAGMRPLECDCTADHLWLCLA
ncbi:MAG: hypothetical protein ACXVDD_14925 [Polyangia bacterium]